MNLFFQDEDTEENIFDLYSIINLYDCDILNINEEKIYLFDEINKIKKNKQKIRQYMKYIRQNILIKSILITKRDIIFSKLSKKRNIFGDYII
jgi:hypothetical protein